MVRDRWRQMDKEPDRRQGWETEGQRDRGTRRHESVKSLFPSVSRPGIWTFSQDDEGVSRVLWSAPGASEALARLTVPLHLAYHSPSANAGR